MAEAPSQRGQKRRCDVLRDRLSFDVSHVGNAVAKAFETRASV